MRISIYGLDPHYMDAVLEMGGTCYEHDGVVDVKFIDCVDIMTDGTCINLTSASVGMVLSYDEFFSISID